jgi:hypothetical protein
VRTRLTHDRQRCPQTSNLRHCVQCLPSEVPLIRSTTVETIPIRAALMWLVTCAMLAAGCGQAASPRPGTPSASPTTTASTDQPSAAARMICEPEARDEIVARLGIQVSKVLAPTWSDHVYACRYVFPNGVMVLSVKDFPDPPMAWTYFTAMRERSGASATLDGLGDNAFIKNDGTTVVVQKQSGVLVVDVTDLPARVGKPTIARSQAALAVATIIIGCWTGD